MGYGHTVVASSPIDVNLAKQINILLENLGMPKNRMMIDPTTGGLGYGLEYSYSVMEPIQMAALAQGDDKLQLPLINNLANEIWKCKEANQSVADAPLLGDPERRAILMECVGAVTYLLAGSGILIMRHPEAVRLVRAFIDLISDGGSAAGVEPIQKELPAVNIDFSKLAFVPNLAIEEEKAKKEPAKKAQVTPASKEESKPAPAAAKIEASKIDQKDAPRAEAAVHGKIEAVATAKAQSEAQAKAEAAAKIEAEAAAKAKAQQDAARLKAELEATAKAEAKAKAEAQARTAFETAEQSLKESRAKEREALQSKHELSGCKSAPAVTPATDQKSEVDKIIIRLDRIHRRVLC